MANENRLIDANALREQMFSYYGCVNENTSKEYYRGETLMNYEVADLIEDCIDNAPAVDAIPVVHGRLLDYSTIAFTEKCSVCGFCVPWKEDGRLNRYNYCPNCGAKMDGDGNG